MESTDFVQLALKILACSQKELAAQLNVSPTQITKWKKGEHMSLDMEVKFRHLTGIGDQSPSFILAAGSPENAEKWDKLIHYIAELAHDNSESGYYTYPLQDEMDLLCVNTVRVLSELGISLPAQFPSELDIDYENDDYDDNEKSPWELIEENPHASLIKKIYESLNGVYGFYQAYIDDLMNDDDLNLYDTPAVNIEPCLISLAACKIDTSDITLPLFKEFRYRVIRDYEEWINIVKLAAFRARIPLKAELCDLIYRTDGELEMAAESESMGFNQDKLHPDIYMNELLVGMRLIHQVLPVIMKKLGINSDEFTVDESELRIE